MPQLADIPLEDCAGLDPFDPAPDVIDRRLTAIDAEIARLTLLRDCLAAQPARRTEPDTAGTTGQGASGSRCLALPCLGVG
ncbi:hypothetical protein [Saccharopolyspora sp. NPDC002376]